MNIIPKLTPKNKLKDITENKDLKSIPNFKEIEFKEIGIYVHIPFCKKRCYYCDFITFANKDNLIEKYISSLCVEIDNIKNHNVSKNSTQSIVTSIFFGGGSPSYIDSKYIKKILEKIKENYLISNHCEITIELNPENINEQKLKNYLQSGINRISIGLQSTNNKILEEIGRIHTFEVFKEKYNLAKKYFNNINIDLMFSLPYQDKNTINSTINEVIKLEPTHISAYSLITHPNSYMDRKFKILQNFDEDLDRELYHTIVDSLEKNGFSQYEISNFSKSNYICKHNYNCWKQKEYVAFGISASSFFNNTRYKNTNNLEKYMQIYSDYNVPNLEKKSYQIEEILDEKSKTVEKLMLAFRLKEAINTEDFQNIQNLDNIFNYLKNAQILTEENIPTIKAFDLNNYIINYIDNNIIIKI